MLDAERRLGRRRCTVHRPGLQHVPDHELGHVAHGELLRGPAGDHRTVPQHGDPVGDLGQLVQPVADVDHRDTGVPHGPDRGEHGADLAVGEDGRRLVEDEDDGILRECLGDAHELLLGHREVRRPDLGEVGRQADALEQLDHALPLGAAVDDAVSPDLAADEQVLRDGELTEEVRLLVDGRDPGVQGGRRAARGELAPVDDDRALVGGLRAGDDLDQRRLAGAVLTDDRVHLAGLQLEVDAPEGADAAVPLLDAGQRQHRGTAGRARSTSLFVRRGHLSSVPGRGAGQRWAARPRRRLSS